MPDGPAPDGPAPGGPAPGVDLAAVARVYDRIAGEYAGRFGDDLRPGSGDRAFLEVALESARADGPVLDVGCGPGQIAAIAVGAGMPAVGIDISMNMLALARRRVPAAAFLAADARALPLTSASCRAVAAFYWLHHLPRAMLPSVLAELRRVVRGGGTLVVAAHLGTGERRVTREENDTAEHLAVTLYGKDELAEQVRAAGFRVESMGTRAPRADEFPAEHGFLRARAA